MTHIESCVGKGFIPTPIPLPVARYSDIIFGAPQVPFDWIMGFDLSRTIPFKVEDQGGSQSCVGQAWAKYAEALEYIENGVYTDLSAAFIYSRIWVPPDGGAWGFRGGDIMKTLGVSREVTTPSYEGIHPPSEIFMRIQDNRVTTFAEARAYRGAEPAYVDPDLEKFARAIRDRNGMVFGVIGTNQGFAELGGGFIRPPKVGETTFGHFLFAVGAVMIGGKKYIKVLNSWGANWGSHGYGYVGEDYFSAGYVTSGLTLVDLPAEPMTFEAIKVVGSPEVYLVRDGKKTHVHDASAFSLVGDWSKIREVTQAEFDAIPDSGFEIATLVNN